jgi:DNA mismatch repair protein MutS2
MHESFASAPLEWDKLVAVLDGLTMTALGRERVAVWKPDVDRTRIESELDRTEEMADCLRYDDPLPLDGLADIRGALKRIHAPGTYLPPAEFLPVLQTVETSSRVREYFKARSVKYPLLSTATASLHSYPEVGRAFRHALDENGELRDDASPNLRRIRRDLKSKSAEVRKKLEALVRSYARLGYAAEAIVTVRQGRAVLPIKDEHKRAVRGFIHDESASGQTVYIEPEEALEINNDLRRLSIEEGREIERILIGLADLLRSRLDDIHTDLSVLGDLDFLYAKGRLAGRLNAVKPRLNTEGYLRIVNGRHPLLWLKEMSRPANDRRIVVPLNLELGRQARSLIISGPNAGGKTVTLKTVGLLCLMAQSGMPVPADIGSDLAIFERILADIGDDQSIENDLSTFSSHAAHLAGMLNAASPRTLALIDEVGGGTDPHEGASLSMAVLEALHERHGLCIATTHQGALKTFAYESEGFENGSMEFDHDTLQPTYVFRPGVPGSSYALEISARMGMHAEVIARARHFLGREAEKLEDMIQHLHREIQIYEKLRAELDRERARLEGLETLYGQRVADLKRRESLSRKETLEARKRLLDETRYRIEIMMEELKKAGRDRASLLKVRRSLDSERSGLDAEISEVDRENERPLEDLSNPREGDRVFVKTMGIEGTLVSWSEESGEAEITIGSLRTRVRLDDLARAPTPPEERRRTAVGERIDWTTANLSTELDLRGLTAQEAVEEVHRYLSDAHSLGFARVTLIHGKGSGVLRKTIRQLLERDARVEGFRLGQWGEGDTGVTIVDLKKD